MSSAFPHNDIVVGSILYLIFAFISYIKTPDAVKGFFRLQLIVLYLLLLTIHIYAFNNLYTFPALGEDSLFYDKLANYLSQSIRSGEFDFGFNHYYGFSPHYYRVQNYTVIDTHVPYGFVIPLSLIYTVFGYLPFVAKVFNVLVFHWASKTFLRILVYYNISGKALYRTLFLFAFFPPLMVSSFSFVKESLLMFAFLKLILLLLNKEIYKSLPWFIVAVLIRPYTPFIFMIVYIFYNRKVFLEKFGRFAIISILITGILSLISFSAFDLGSFISESNYTIHYNYSDSSEMAQAMGLIELINMILTSPLKFIQYFIYGWFTSLFKPDPWHFSLSDTIFSNKYINAGTFNVSYLAYYLYSFILYYMHFTFLKYILNRKKYKGIDIKFELLLIFILITSIIFLRSVELRYIIMSVYPFALVLFAKIKSFPVNIRNTNTVLIYLALIGGLLLVPIIF